MEAVLAELASRQGVKPPRVIHQFAVEWVPMKQQFLIDHHPQLRRLWPDARCLIQELAYDVISETLQPVEGCDWLWLGFPCTDLRTF